MPVIVPDQLPARAILASENLVTLGYSEAVERDAGTLQVLILNLMPLKDSTESQLLRLLAGSPRQIEVQFIRPKDHRCRNTSQQHLELFYKTFDEVRNRKFDGMIITGAPVEHLPFEEVGYWKEFTEILDWTVHNVTSVLFICWAAQAGMYHFHGIPKYLLPAKQFGVFEHTVRNPDSPIARGLGSKFLAPHSRHTEVRRSDIEKAAGLEIIGESDEAGIFLTVSGSHIYYTGHPEYDAGTMRDEYFRDLAKGLDIHIPAHYFPGDDPSKEPVSVWQGTARQIWINWIENYLRR